MIGAIVESFATMAASFIFLVAASYKTLGAPELAEALEALGIPRSVSHELARPFWILEAAFAVIVVLGLRGISDVALILGGLVLIAVGTRAELLATPIPCSCFGARSGSTLGLRQVVLGGLLVVVGVLLWKSPQFRASDPSEIAVRVTAVAMAAYAFRLVADVGLLREQVRLRRIFSAEYPA